MHLKILKKSDKMNLTLWKVTLYLKNASGERGKRLKRLHAEYSPQNQ